MVSHRTHRRESACICAMAAAIASLVHGSEKGVDEVDGGGDEDPEERGGEETAHHLAEGMNGEVALCSGAPIAIL